MSTGAKDRRNPHPSGRKLGQALPWPGRHYHQRYGYPVEWALLAELAWRFEHIWWRHDGQLLAPLARRAYGWRKAAERRGSGMRDAS